MILPPFVVYLLKISYDSGTTQLVLNKVELIISFCQSGCYIVISQF